MKIQNKRDFQQAAFNYLSDFDFQGFMYLYEKCTAKPYNFWLLMPHLHEKTLHILERIF